MTEIYVVTETDDYGYRIEYVDFFKSKESAEKCIKEQNEMYDEDFEDEPELRPEVGMETIIVKGEVKDGIWSMTYDEGEGYVYSGAFFNTESKAKSLMWRLKKGIPHKEDPEILWEGYEDFEIQYDEVKE